MKTHCIALLIVSASVASMARCEETNSPVHTTNDSIMVSGAVRNAKDYWQPISIATATNVTLKAVIQRAGGFDEYAYSVSIKDKSGIQRFRKKVDQHIFDETISVKPGDSVRISDS